MTQDTLGPNFIGMASQELWVLKTIQLRGEYKNQPQDIVSKQKRCKILFEIILPTRAGEFTKKNLYHGKNRVFGPKNAQKKFGSPTPNFPPPQFGK